MKLWFLELVTLIIEAATTGPQEASLSYPSADHCHASTTQYRMEVLPGGGFDNLRNLDMGLVHAYEYKDCQVSQDSKYLLPKNVFLIPFQQSKVELFAEYFDHWDKYTDMTSASINTAFHIFSVSGKFSAGYSSMKTRQSKLKIASVRTQARHKLYTVKIQPGAQLHPTFKSALFDIAANLQNNNTEYANYLAQLLVRDYGTHYVTSVDAGAIIAKTDFFVLKGTELSSAEAVEITASASASFFGLVSGSISTSFSHRSTADSGYENSITHSEITTYGGPPYQPTNFTLSDWEKGVPDALVAIDRSGEPLHLAINSNTLPELPDITVQEVAETVDRAITSYYKVNTREGCTDKTSPNFNFQANVDDKSCSLQSTNFSFGGVYQICANVIDPGNTICEQVQEKNPLTGDYSCPQHYTPILLHTGTVTKVVTEREPCFSHWFCFNEKQLKQAQYWAYWCVALPGSTVPPDTGYLFGGYYTSQESNPLTGGQSCPKYYLSLRLLEDLTVCVSDNYEVAKDNHISFGGFHTCRNGNPLASAKPSQDSSIWPRACPAHFTPQLILLEDNCEVNFCVHKGAFSAHSLLPVKLPPFRSHPKHKLNVTNTLALRGLNGDVWLVNKTGAWYKKETGVDNGEDLLMEMSLLPGMEEWPTITEQQTSLANSTGTMAQPSPQGLSNIAVAAISVVTTLVVGTLVIVVTMLGRRMCSKKKNALPSEYSELNSSVNRLSEQEERA